MYNSFNEINNFAIRLVIFLQTPEKMKQQIWYCPLMRYLFVMLCFLSITYGVLKQISLFHSEDICVFEVLLIIQTLINMKPDRSRMYVLKLLWWTFLRSWVSHQNHFLPALLLLCGQKSFSYSLCFTIPCLPFPAESCKWACQICSVTISISSVSNLLLLYGWPVVISNWSPHFPFILLKKSHFLATVSLNPSHLQTWCQMTLWPLYKFCLLFINVCVFIPLHSFFLMLDSLSYS